jgi:hypothetical protein
MPKRIPSWSDHVASLLRKKDGARDWVLAAIEQDESPKEALADMIRRYGIKEFVHDYKLSRATVYRFIAGQALSMSSFELLLLKLGLKLTLEPQEKAVKSTRKRK